MSTNYSYNILTTFSQASIQRSSNKFVGTLLDIVGLLSKLIGLDFHRGANWNFWQRICQVHAWPVQLFVFGQPHVECYFQQWPTNEMNILLICFITKKYLNKQLHKIYYIWYLLYLNITCLDKTRIDSIRVIFFK